MNLSESLVSKLHAAASKIFDAQHKPFQLSSSYVRTLDVELRTAVETPSLGITPHLLKAVLDQGYLTQIDQGLPKDNRYDYQQEKERLAGLLLLLALIQKIAVTQNDSVLLTQLSPLINQVQQIPQAALPELAELISNYPSQDTISEWFF
jgi:hypothetical protein